MCEIFSALSHYVLRFAQNSLSFHHCHRRRSEQLEMQKRVHLFVLFLAFIHSTASLPPYIIKQHDEREVLFKITSKGTNPRPFSLLCEAKGDPPPK
jgi:hypothetical protein